MSASCSQYHQYQVYYVTPQEDLLQQKSVCRYHRLVSIHQTFFAFNKVSSGPPLCQFHIVLLVFVLRGTVSACEDVALRCCRRASCLTGKSEAEQKRGAAGLASCSGDHLSFYGRQVCVNKSPHTAGVLLRPCLQWKDHLLQMRKIHCLVFVPQE